MKEKTYRVPQNVWFMVKLAWTSGEKKVLALGLLSALLAVALNLARLYISPAVLAVLEKQASLTELLKTIGGFVLVTLFLSAAAAYVDVNTLHGRVTVRQEIMNLLNRKAATTSYPNVDDEKFRKLLTKASECVSSNNQATEAVWGTLVTLLTDGIGFLIYLRLLTAVPPILIVVILATAAVGYLIRRQVNGYRYLHREEEAEYERQMDYLFDQAKDLGAAKDIRIFGLKSWLEELYAKAMACYMVFQGKSQSACLRAELADLMLTFLRNGAAYAYLIYLVLEQNLGVAEFLLLFSAAGGFSEWVSGLLEGFGILYKQSLDLSTVRECLEYTEPFRFEGGVPIPAGAAEIRLENVSFRYPGASENILKNLNLTLHPGEKLAVVGLNGAGKTTLVKLISGLLDPTEGRVLLDGKDIREFNRSEYYTLFSEVFQDFSLLAGTVAANVAQNEEKIELPLVKNCLEKAGLRKKIEALPDAYETCLNRQVYEDALLLSGGETQRLMLARALYKDAPFIILDEPTAALDPIAESELYQKYHELTKNKSSIYISHRLASTRFCDRIVMIGNGGICEEGTHEELVKQGGKYAKLYEVQSKYYKEGEEKNG